MWTPLRPATSTGSARKKARAEPRCVRPAPTFLWTAGDSSPLSNPSGAFPAAHDPLDLDRGRHRAALHVEAEIAHAVLLDAHYPVRLGQRGDAQRADIEIVLELRLRGKRREREDDGEHGTHGGLRIPG